MSLTNYGDKMCMKDKTWGTFGSTTPCNSTMLFSRSYAYNPEEEVYCFTTKRVLIYHDHYQIHFSVSHYVCLLLIMRRDDVNSDNTTSIIRKYWNVIIHVIIYVKPCQIRSTVSNQLKWRRNNYEAQRISSNSAALSGRCHKMSQCQFPLVSSSLVEICNPGGCNSWNIIPPSCPLICTETRRLQIQIRVIPGVIPTD